jgi:hypothetical protein
MRDRVLLELRDPFLELDKQIDQRLGHRVLLLVRLRWVRARLPVVSPSASASFSSGVIQSTS